MIYYRIAMRSTRTNLWQWKTTTLTSLDALFGAIRLYSPAPKHLLRIFFASSTANLDDMLGHENSGLMSNSISVELFLKEKRIDAQEMLRLEAEAVAPQELRQAIPAALNLVRAYVGFQPATQPEAGGNEADITPPASKRLNNEQQPGGDHDIPYVFSLPQFMPQALAWTILLSRVRRGELVP